MVLAFLYLLVEQYYQFETGLNIFDPWITNRNGRSGWFRIVLSAFVATYWLAQAFRFGGWRWERTPTG